MFYNYFLATKWKNSIDKTGKPTIYYCSVTGKPLFKAPIGRKFLDFYNECLDVGWPCFRDNETNWNHVRVLLDGEIITVYGVHLGRVYQDEKGANVYSIDVVAIAGNP